MTRQQRLGTVCGTLAAALGLAALTAGSNAKAAERQAAQGAVIADRPTVADPESPSELAREGMAKMLQALNKLAESVPQYEMPQINEHGDIIVRRKRPETSPPSQPAKTPDESDGQPI